MHYRSHSNCYNPQRSTERFAITEEADMLLIYVLAEGNAEQQKGCIVKGAPREMHRTFNLHHNLYEHESLRGSMHNEGGHSKSIQNILLRAWKKSCWNAWTILTMPITS
ncbi:hypothetical protein TNCV_4490201 [Trichonephila clavipes]|nr:hypothetical protein TNCV_4490201 [Trichonephila clavipes]